MSRGIMSAEVAPTLAPSTKDCVVGDRRSELFLPCIVVCSGRTSPCREYRNVCLEVIWWTVLSRPVPVVTRARSFACVRACVRVRLSNAVCNGAWQW